MGSLVVALGLLAIFKYAGFLVGSINGLFGASIPVPQIDLPSDKPSGLKEAIRILDGIDDIAICRLTGADVVRHALVQKIIAAYEQDDKQKEKCAAAAAKKPAVRKTTVRKKA